MPQSSRKYTQALAYATGTADRTGATLDMSGYQEVDMIVCVAAVEAGGENSIKAQSDSDPAFGSPQDIAGTAVAIADDDDSQIFVLTVQNPPERYVRLYVDKDTTHACAEAAVYVQYGPDRAPITSASASVTVESHVWPAVGTA